MRTHYRLGIDAGGTFTDFLLIKESDGSTHTAKVPSTPDDSSRGVLNGIEKVCSDAGAGQSAELLAAAGCELFNIFQLPLFLLLESKLSLKNQKDELKQIFYYSIFFYSYKQLIKNHPKQGTLTKKRLGPNLNPPQ